MPANTIYTIDIIIKYNDELYKLRSFEESSLLLELYDKDNVNDNKGEKFSIIEKSEITFENLFLLLEEGLESLSNEDYDKQVKEIKERPEFKDLPSNEQTDYIVKLVKENYNFSFINVCKEANIKTKTYDFTEIPWEKYIYKRNIIMRNYIRNIYRVLFKGILNNFEESVGQFFDKRYY